MQKGASSYLSINKRNFKQALVHLLETEYKIIGSHKVIQMIAEDVEDIQNEIKPHSRKEGGYQEIKRMVRMIKASFKQGGLLSIAEVATIMNYGLDNARKKLIGYQIEKGEVLPLKGIIPDQGASPAHKGIIIHLYEKKIAPPDIARQIGHSLEAVDGCISNYERVKTLLEKGINVKEIGQLLGRGLRTVKEYERIATLYHPEVVTRESKI